MEIHELIEQQFREAMASFGVAEFRQKEQKCWLVKVIDDLEIEMAYEEEFGGKVVFSAFIGKPAAEVETAVHSLLLQYHYSWEEGDGCHAAVDPGNGTMVLRQELMAPTLNPSLLQDHVGHFSRRVLTWRQLVKNFTPETSVSDFKDWEMLQTGIRI